MNEIKISDEFLNTLSNEIVTITKIKSPVFKGDELTIKLSDGNLWEIKTFHKYHKKIKEI